MARRASEWAIAYHASRKRSWSAPEPIGGGDAGSLEPRAPRRADLGEAAVALYELAIQRGARMWNEGNREGCAGVYEVTINAMIGLAGDQLPSTITEALLEARDRGAEFDALKPHLLPDAEGRPFAETAAQLGISVGNAKIRAHRMKERYRALLEEEVREGGGWVPSDASLERPPALEPRLEVGDRVARVEALDRPGCCVLVLAQA